MEERASYVAVYNDNYGTTDGQVMFESLISQGALALDSSGAYVGAGGFTRHWDSCSSTVSPRFTVDLGLVNAIAYVPQPWLKSSSSGQLITYDDPTSMSLKAQFAVQAGLRGCNIFSMDGDWTGSSWPLTDSVRSGMGL
jgi:chitinase